MNTIQKNDIDNFVKSFHLGDVLEDKVVVITGATGLIGSCVVKSLLALRKKMRIILPVRNRKKALTLFVEDSSQLEIIECDLVLWFKMSCDKCDYIIHLASPTSGKYMIENPVETYMLAIDSTKAILDYAMKAGVTSVIYISSLEYYGQNDDDKAIKEDFLGYVDVSSPRSSYPLGKRATEYLCTSYAKEYGVPVKMARLTQTFGAGVSAEDNRVFAQFARSIIEGNDIVLHTKGESAKPYCYTTDCVSAILYILLKGKDGEAYNVANQDTYISIKDMALFLKENFNSNIDVIVEEHPEMGYAPVTRLNLLSEKLMSLGWKPSYNLYEMFERLINSLKEDGKKC